MEYLLNFKHIKNKQKAGTPLKKFSFGLDVLINFWKNDFICLSSTGTLSVTQRYI